MNGSTTGPEEIPRRAVGMMQVLAAAYADGGRMPEGPRRGIVDERSALDAVMQLFAIVDEPLQAGQFPEGRGLHAMSMLMLVREYILALPDPPGDEELLSHDLRELVGALAEGRTREGLGG